MAMNLKEIEVLIKEAMPGAIVEIQDLAGDGNHYSATVTSEKFKGKSKIEHIRWSIILLREKWAMNYMH
jgi:stress-induced morphogen